MTIQCEGADKTIQEQINLPSIFNRAIIPIDRLVGEGMIYLDFTDIVVSKISKQS